MAAVRDAPDEKKARTRPLKAFNKTVTALEDRITEDQLDTDIDNALRKMAKAFDLVNDLQEAYLAARQGSDSEELEDDP